MTNLEVRFMETASSFFTRKVNWEQVRADAAIAAMQGLISGKPESVRMSDWQAAQIAVGYADALVETLKEKSSK